MIPTKEVCSGKNSLTVIHYTSPPFQIWHLALFTLSSPERPRPLLTTSLATSQHPQPLSLEEEHPLNTSDHLPIISNLNMSLLTLAPRSSDHNNSLDWISALRHGCIPQYASLTDEVVVPLLNKDYCSVEEIEADISHVSNALIEAIPHFRCSNSNSNRVSDPHMLAESCILPSVESCRLSQIWSSF